MTSDPSRQPERERDGRRALVRNHRPGCRAPPGAVSRPRRRPGRGHALSRPCGRRAHARRRVGCRRAMQPPGNSRRAGHQSVGHRAPALRLAGFSCRAGRAVARAGEGRSTSRRHARLRPSRRRQRAFQYRRSPLAQAEPGHDPCGGQPDEARFGAFLDRRRSRRGHRHGARRASCRRHPDFAAGGRPGSPSGAGARGAGFHC